MKLNVCIRHFLKKYMTLASPSEDSLYRFDFDYKRSRAYKELHKRDPYNKLTIKELVSVAQVIEKNLRIPLNRKEKRRKIQKMKQKLLRLTAMLMFGCMVASSIPTGMVQAEESVQAE